jgi:hypothetical protein
MPCFSTSYCCQLFTPHYLGLRRILKCGSEEVVQSTNLYAVGLKNCGGTRGHQHCNCTAVELLVWDGIVKCNSIAESWMMNQSNTYDREIAEVMHFRRWLDIKVCLKQNGYFKQKRQTGLRPHPEVSASVGCNDSHHEHYHQEGWEGCNYG